MGLKTNESQCSLQVCESQDAKYCSSFLVSTVVIPSMVKHHKRKAVPTVQRVTWIDKVTTRGVSTRQMRVSTPKTPRRSSPAKPSVSPSKHGSYTVDQSSSEPLKLPKRHVRSYLLYLIWN